MWLRSWSAACAMAAVLLAAVSGCGGLRGGMAGSSLLPPLGNDDAAPFWSSGTTLHVTVAPPPKGTTRARILVIEADGKPHSRRKLALSAGARCKGTKSGALNCSMQLPLSASTHVLSVTAQASGKKLSVNDLLVTISDCKRNAIDLALYEPASSLAAVPASNLIRGSARRGFVSKFGGGPLIVTALDKKRETIVGPGSPSISVSSSSSKIAISSPRPNTLLLSVASSERIDKVVKSKIAVNAGSARLRFTLRAERTTLPTPTASPTPAPCQSTSPSSSPSASPSSSPTSGPSSTPSSPPQPTPTPNPLASTAAIYVAYSYASNASGAVMAYDEQGNVAATGSWAGAGKPFSIVWDPNVRQFYLTAQATGQTTVQAYAPSGSHVSSVTFAETNAAGLALDSHLNEIYVASGSQSTIHAYDELGHAKALSPGFPKTIITSFAGLAFDSNDDRFYLGNTNGGNDIEVYDENGNAQSASGGFAAPASACGGGCTPFAVTYDPQNQDIYVLWAGLVPSITAYDESGNAVALTGSFSGLISPNAIAVDTHDGWLYVTDGTSVKAFDAQGNVQSPTGTFAAPSSANAANGIVVVPPA
ncbi:MAG TPA: hypothetical protein VNG31_00920 [Candidatus Baltobacteraceae bacterium]|nr:hypothetical protein [Candidatus Baltobacteraceae bacterium]